MLLPTDPDVQEALDSIGQQVRQNLASYPDALWAHHTILVKERFHDKPQENPCMDNEEVYMYLEILALVKKQI